MERPAYRYELLMTRADGTHVYAVFAPDAGQIGSVDSRREGRRKTWLAHPFFGEERALTRVFASRTTAADVLYALWREWRARLDQAQGR